MLNKHPLSRANLSRNFISCRDAEGTSNYNNGVIVVCSCKDWMVRDAGSIDFDAQH